MQTWTRRDFAKNLAVVTTATALSQTRVLGANERVRLGFIGLGNRGDQVLDAFLMQPDGEVVALCDLYEPYLDFAARKSGGHPARSRITAGCWNKRTWTPWLSAPPTIGMRCR